MGQITALEDHTSQDRGIYEGAKSSIHASYNSLKRWTSNITSSESIDNTSIHTTHDDTTTIQTQPQPQPLQQGNDTNDAAGGDDSNNSIVQVDGLPNSMSMGFDLFQDNNNSNTGFDAAMQMPDSWIFTDWDFLGED